MKYLKRRLGGGGGGRDNKALDWHLTRGEGNSNTSSKLFYVTESEITEAPPV